MYEESAANFFNNTHASKQHKVLQNVYACGSVHIYDTHGSQPGLLSLWKHCQHVIHRIHLGFWNILKYTL